MRLCAILFTLLVLLHSPLHAQQGGTITGSITDADTGIPIAGVNISLVGTTFGTTTSPNGIFNLSSIPSGRYTLRVSMVGYTLIQRSVDVREGESLRIDLALVPSAIVTPGITITATRARERETPVTFSTLEAHSLEERYTVQDVPQLLSELPSTTFYSENGNGIGYNYMSLRGFDQRRLSVMINGVPQNDPEDHNVYWLDFPDLTASTTDIQVQRGAGSAFYGPPAIGGSVNIVTSAHSNQRLLSASAGIGSYNTRKYLLSYSSGLIDKTYSVYGKYSKTLSSGYRNRAWIDFDSYYFSAIRYDESMTTQVNMYGGPIADGLAYYGIPRSDVTDREKRKYNPIQRPEEIENFSQPHFELLHEWRISPSIALNNTIFYVAGAGFFDYDGSWADTTYFRLTGDFGYSPKGNPTNSLIRAFVDNRQIGWLPRVTWNHTDGEFILGAELRRHRSLHWGRIQWAENLPEGLDPDRHYYEYRGAKDIVSVYVNELYKMMPAVTIMANIQYAYSRYQLYDEQYVHTEFSVPYQFFNPRFGINYNASDKWNFYASISRTSREPRLTNLYDAAESSGESVPQFETTTGGSYDFSKPFVKPETLTDIEIGTGFTQSEYRFGLNIFWMDFKDEIVKSGGVDRFGQPRTGNAERTRHQGIEVSGAAEILPGLSLQGNATYSRNRLIRYTVYIGQEDISTGENVIVSKSLDGNRIGGFPDFLCNLRLEYRYEGLLASLLMQHVGDQYTNNLQQEDLKVDSYTIFNGSLAYRFRNVLNAKSIEMKLQVNNIFDLLYAAYGIDEEFFPAAERNFFFGISVEL